MTTWNVRPVEVANLLNPAFCGEILRLCIKEYSKVSSTAFPYPLTFLVLPIVLHRKTRECIGERGTMHLHVWLQSHPDVRVGFAERAHELIPFTIESLAFLLQVRALGITPQGGLAVPGLRRPANIGPPQGEVADCYRKAILVGRWFARAGSSSNIYTMWGVKP
jgi:hypothetical protein